MVSTAALARRDARNRSRELLDRTLGLVLDNICGGSDKSVILQISANPILVTMSW